MLREAGAKPLVLDLDSPDDVVRQAAQDAIQVYGHVDVLVNNAGTLEVLNQPEGQTLVLDTFAVNHVTVHVVSAIIGAPPSYFFGMGYLQADEFIALQNISTGTVTMPDAGFTAFVPLDATFDQAKQMANATDPTVLFGNHVRLFP